MSEVVQGVLHRFLLVLTLEDVQHFLLVVCGYRLRQGVKFLTLIDSILMFPAVCICLRIDVLVLRFFHLFQLHLLHPKELHVLRVHPFFDVSLSELLRVEIVINAKVVLHALVKLCRS